MSGVIAQRIHNLGSRLKWVVSFTPRPLYRRYPLDRKLCVPQIQSGLGGEDKTDPFTLLLEIEPRSSNP